MTEIWEPTFAKQQLMWGSAPALSAVSAAAVFARHDVNTVLIPGVGYGRNAVPFLALGMSVTGIEVSETARALARSALHLEIPIHHGSVEDMPFDAERYDGIFCYGLLYLLDAHARAKLLRDCSAQLVDGGTMIFTVLSKTAASYGRGTRLGDDWFETHPGVRLYFYDEAAIRRDFGSLGVVDISLIDEPGLRGGAQPFFNVVCRP